MDVNHETLRIVRNIDRKQDVIVSQTAPRMPQLWAAITGLVVCAVGSFVLDKGDVPFLSPLYEQASDYVANNAATTGIWIGDMIGNTDRSMPALPVAGSISGLDALESCRVMVVLRGLESSHDYSQVNWAFYLGGFQQGASALAAVGLIRQDAIDAAGSRVKRGLPPEHGAFLRNPANWKGSNYSAFLKDHALQDRAALALANLNVKAGFNSRALIKNAPAKIAGYVFAAHLKGSGAANSWYLRGKDSKDGNGTRTSDYAQMGEAAINKRSNYCEENTRTVPDWLKWLDVEK